MQSRKGAPQKNGQLGLALQPALWAALPMTKATSLISIFPSTSDLYNWKSQKAPFSENSDALITLLETVPFGMTVSNYYRSSLQQKRERENPDRG